MSKSQISQTPPAPIERLQSILSKIYYFYYNNKEKTNRRGWLCEMNELLKNPESDFVEILSLCLPQIDDDKIDDGFMRVYIQFLESYRFHEMRTKDDSIKEKVELFACILSHMRMDDDCDRILKERDKFLKLTQEQQHDKYFKSGRKQLTYRHLVHYSYKNFSPPPRRNDTHLFYLPICKNSIYKVSDEKRKENILNK